MIYLPQHLRGAVADSGRMNIPDIANCIEGEIQIASIPLEPGLTNTDVITGQTNENAIPNEGKITFDLRFFVILPDGEYTKIIINVEAQKDSEPGYDIITRAIFYCARLLSSQLDQEFTNKTTDKRKYDNIRKVYSIWICMDTKTDTKDSIIEYHIAPNTLFLGKHNSRIKEHRYDLLSAVMINLGGNTMTIEFQQEVEEMCNLSGYVERQGQIEGRENLVKLFTWLQEQGRSEEANQMMQLENEELRTRLWEEYTKIQI